MSFRTDRIYISLNVIYFTGSLIQSLLFLLFLLFGLLLLSFNFFLLLLQIRNSGSTHRFYH